MIKKKYISRFLALGLIFNNLLVVSNANSLEVSTVYQTLEGEYITVDNSTGGELHEIEIFGNTVQDENNLEDIQSVGDLYVDENGNPILDNQGREQYKLNIRSSNLIGSSMSYEDFSAITPVNIQGFTAFYIENIEYVTAKLNDKSILAPTDSGIKIYHTVLKEIGEEVTIVPDPTLENYLPFYNWDNIRNSIGKEDLLEAIRLGHLELSIKIKDKPLIYKNFSGLAEFDETTILLPCQLHKVGDVADRLYWDNEKGKYIIEKNIDVQTPPITSYTRIIGQIFSNNETFTFKVPSEIKYSKAYTSDNEKGLIVSSLKVCDSSKYNDIGYDSYIYKSSDNFSIVFSRGTFFEEPRFIKWLEESKLTFYYSEGFTPQLIETNITSKIKIPTYNGKTHIYIETENGINPTLKVTVDRIYQVAKNAVEEAKVNPTTENISIARMYVNILPDSIYKDQLQEELNYIFNTDIKLDKKTISSSVDVYIKFDNSISMALSTNSITFEDLSGVDDVEMQNAVEILVSSSLPYQLNAYLMDEIHNSDKTKKIDIDRLEIKEGKASIYKPFVSINNKVVLEDNCESGNNLSHNIDLKFYGSNAYESDIYKTVIKFEAEQK